MLTFYLVRHGAKEAIPFDPPLTQVGLKQAENTASHLLNIPFKEIVSSPKLRARQTAEIIAQSQSLPVVADSRLIERLEWESDKSFDDFINEWNKTDLDRTYEPKKGSTSQANGAQMRNIVDELTQKHSEGNILIVSHGGTIGDLLRNLFTEEAIEHVLEPNSGAKYIDLPECSITIIQADNEGFKLIQTGGISHLSNPLI